MRIYIGFDDTDTVDSDRGTGKLARWFENEFPNHADCGVLFASNFCWMTAIPYTTHNSSACAIVETSNSFLHG